MDEIQGVQYEGILAKGYGLIPQMLTRDKDLSIEAKAIYAYLAAFAGTTGQAFPGVVLICAELNISKKRYLSHRKALIDKGYIEIIRERLESGFSKNLYILKQNIPYGVDSLPYDSLPYQNVGLQGVTVQNDPTISNSFTNNSSINNKESKSNRHDNDISSSLIDKSFLELKDFYELKIAKTNFTTDKKLDDLLEEFHDSKLIIEAMQVALAKDKNPLAYSKGILKNWREEHGITTYEQLAARKENSNEVGTKSTIQDSEQLRISAENERRRKLLRGKSD